MMQGREQALKREHNARAWQAWVTAFLPYQEKPPRLADMTFRDKPAKPRTWEDEFAAFAAWAGEATH